MKNIVLFLSWKRLHSFMSILMREDRDKQGNVFARLLCKNFQQAGIMQDRVCRVRLTSKGQLVIPKALREKYKLKEGSLIRLIVEDERMLLMPETGAPFTGLRGLMKHDWKKYDLDELLEPAKRSLFKV